MSYHPATHAIHADNRINITTDVAPPIHTSTTFRYPENPEDYNPAPKEGEYLDLSTPLVYSRLTNSNINRLETILAPLTYPNATKEELGELGNNIVSYSSGLSAFHALLVNVVPKVIAISGGYHGCHGVRSYPQSTVPKMHCLTNELGNRPPQKNAQRQNSGLARRRLHLG
jgi:cystathionine gamma-synthase